jgi:hypothetical protein
VFCSRDRARFWPRRVCLNGVRCRSSTNRRRRSCRLPECHEGARPGEYQERAIAQGFSAAFAEAHSAFMADRMEPMFGRFCDCSVDIVGGWQAYAKDPAKAASMAKPCEDQVVANAEWPTPTEQASFIASWSAAHPNEKLATTLTLPAVLSAAELEMARTSCVVASRQPNEAKLKKALIDKGQSEAFATATAAFAMASVQPAFVSMCECMATAFGGWAAFLKQPRETFMTDPAVKTCVETFSTAMATSMPSKEALLAFRAQWIAEHPDVSVTATTAPAPAP